MMIKKENTKTNSSYNEKSENNDARKATNNRKIDIDNFAQTYTYDNSKKVGQFNPRRISVRIHKFIKN